MCSSGRFILCRSRVRISAKEKKSALLGRLFILSTFVLGGSDEDRTRANWGRIRLIPSWLLHGDGLMGLDAVAVEVFNDETDRVVAGGGV